MKLDMGWLYEFSSTFVEGLHSEFKLWDAIEVPGNQKIYQKKKNDEEEADPF